MARRAHHVRKGTSRITPRTGLWARDAQSLDNYIYLCRLNEGAKAFLQEIINGVKDDLYLVYIPNACFATIHNEWWASYQRSQQEETEKKEGQREQVRKADQQKIQC
jgi:hypothetical protein